MKQQKNDPLAMVTLDRALHSDSRGEAGRRSWANLWAPPNSRRGRMPPRYGSPSCKGYRSANSLFV